MQKIADLWVGLKQNYTLFQTRHFIWNVHWTYYNLRAYSYVLFQEK